MKLHSLIIDNFLSQFEALRMYADEAAYRTIENPVDGVSYPGICSHIPTEIGDEVRERLSLVTGRTVDVRYLFIRLSLEGVPVPHQAHTDATMGRYSLMLYLNRPEDCRGGTALVRHVSGMDSNPADDEQAAIWKRDTNAPERWTPYMLCEMRPNRAFVFDAALMHCALPIGGFGGNPRNGRLVLTGFFE